MSTSRPQPSPLKCNHSRQHGLWHHGGGRHPHESKKRAPSIRPEEHQGGQPKHMPIGELAASAALRGPQKAAPSLPYHKEQSEPLGPSAKNGVTPPLWHGWCKADNWQDQQGRPPTPQS